MFNFLKFKFEPFNASYYNYRILSRSIFGVKKVALAQVQNGRYTLEALLPLNFHETLYLQKCLQKSAGIYKKETKLY